VGGYGAGVRIERHVECGQIYDATRRELLQLVGNLTDEQRARTVAATPLWSVQDVVSHLVGICADLNAQRFGSGAGEDWTAAQVTSRRGRTMAQLADEWDREAPRFIEGLGVFGYDLGSHYVGDLLQHVGDVHATLGLDPPSGGHAVQAALDFYLASFDDTLVEARAGAVRVCLPEADWVLGPEPVVAEVTASPWELLRALGGRRSETQIRMMDWRGDADAIVPLVSRYPVPTQPVADGG
jgi:uncharacterized protein (TIGR03083 family)